MKPPEHIVSELSDLGAWRSSAGSDISLLDYVGFIATPDLFFAFAELLRPALILHEGAQFIESRFDVTLFEEWRQELRDLGAVQKMMNHIHVSTLFQNQEISNEMAIVVSRTIADYWSGIFSSLNLRGLAFGESFHDAAVTLLSPGS